LITGNLQRGGLKLEAVPDLIGRCRVYGTLTGECVGITHDSRQVQPGMIFAALRGTRTDGAVFTDQAIDNGAVAIVGCGLDLLSRRVPYVEVDAPRMAMADIACALYGFPTRRMKTVGVTGTNGKTTVTFLIRDILRAASLRPGLVGTLRYEVGERLIPSSRTTPESPVLQQMFDEMLRCGCDSVVMEVSSHALVQERVRGIDFDVSVFTNLTQDHLDYHRTVDEYFQAKSRLFARGKLAGKDTRMVVNIDDAWGRKLALRGGSGGLLLTYGMQPEARVQAQEISASVEGIRFRAITPWGDAEIKIPMLGRFSLSNALAALATGGALGIDFETMAHALQQVEPVPGRLERIPNDRGVNVFVDYAHTPDALENVLKSLGEVTGGRLISVFGCGGDRDRMKRPSMGGVSTRHADVTILTSDNPRSEDPGMIIAEIAEGCENRGSVHRIPDRREAISEAISLASPGDCVLIAGKGHESVQVIGEESIRFDDRDVAREVLDNMDRGQRGF